MGWLKKAFSMGHTRFQRLRVVQPDSHVGDGALVGQETLWTLQ